MGALGTSLARLGSGLGIEIRGEDLRVVAVKSRPGGVTVLGSTTVEGFTERPAPEWGRELAAFLKNCGLSHAAATVCLPRRDVIVRQIQLPPMPQKDRQAAVSYQIDGLHPFGDDEICWASATLAENTEQGAPTPVAVVIAERERVDAYANLFEEAGLPVSAFTVSAAALYAALRVRWDEPPRPFLVAEIEGDLMEIYGESAGRPLLSAEMNLRTLEPVRALELAAADLRLDDGAKASLVVTGAASDETPEIPNLEWKSAAELFPAPLGAMSGFDMRQDLTAFAAATENACPRLSWGANLLPEERRKSDSRWRYVPTAAIAALLGILAAGFIIRPAMQDRAYAEALQQRIDQLEAVATETEAAGEEAERVRRRFEILRSLQARTQADLRILSDVSAMTPYSAWLTSFEVRDEGVRLAGEADAAAPLLEAVNRVPLLGEAQFATSLRKLEEGESFQIAARRVEPAPEAESEAVALAPAQLQPAPGAGGGALSTIGATIGEEQP